MENTYLKGFVKISKYVGMHPEYVQAGGGNTSVKIDNNRMVIKASGYQLSDITMTEGYSIVNYPQIVEYFAEENMQLHDEKSSNKVLMDAVLEGKRPSIETFLHAITSRYTLHSHPQNVNVLTAREKGFDILKELFPEAVFVGYATPGIELGDLYFFEVKQNNTNKCRMLFLKNHGVVVSANSADEVIELHEYIIDTINTYLGINMPHIKIANAIYEAIFDTSQKIVYHIHENNSLKYLKEANGGTTWSFAFAPDCLVYCGKSVLNLDIENDNLQIYEKLKNAEDKQGAVKVVYKENEYFIIADNVKKAQEIESVFLFAADVCFMNKDYTMDYLDETTQNKILNLDSEKYRQSLK